MTKKSKVRSLHFISSDLRNSLNGSVYLKGDAMPSNGFRNRQETEGPSSATSLIGYGKAKTKSSTSECTSVW